MEPEVCSNRLLTASHRGPLTGVPAKIVSERLGRSSIAITLDTYSHVLPDMQGRAHSSCLDQTTCAAAAAASATERPRRSPTSPEAILFMT